MKNDNLPKLEIETTLFEAPGPFQDCGIPWN